MILDEDNLIEMEQCSFPGNIGDSCAETSRFVILSQLVKDHNFEIDLNDFLTPIGVLRHPDSPWLENDTSFDQVMPLIIAGMLTDITVANKAKAFIKKDGYKTGNGDLVPPSYLPVIMRNSKFNFIFDIIVILQSLLFLLPYRWSDSKKKLEPMQGSSADYLNFVMILAFAKLTNTVTLPLKIAQKLTPKDKILEKIKSYYAPEPNAFIVSYYQEALEKIF